MKKIVASFLFSLSVLGLSTPLYSTADSLVVKAESETQVNPNKTDIYEDLKEFDLSQYTVDSEADEFDIINTLEWGFDGLNQYYLYLYVFNKSGQNGNYLFNHKNNRVEILYHTYGFKEDTYEHAYINFVNRTDDWKFLKYKLTIENPYSFLFNKKEIIRQYSIVGLEIVHNIGNNIGLLKDYPIGHQWNYCGIGENIEISYVSELTKVELDVHGGTFVYGRGVPKEHKTSLNLNSLEYATDRSWNQEWTQQLAYIYFNVPKIYSDDEELNLYSIHADYSKYDLSYLMYALIDEHPLSFYQDLYDEGTTTYNDVKQYKKDTNYIAHMYFDEIFSSFRKTITAQDYWYNQSRRVRLYTGFIGYQYATLENWMPWDNSIYREYLYHNYGVTNPFANKFKDEDKYGNAARTEAYALPIPNFNTDLASFDTQNFIDLDICESLTGIAPNDEKVYKNINYTNNINPLVGEYKSWDLISPLFTNMFISWAFGNYNVEDYNVDVTDVQCIEEIADDDFETLTDDELRLKYFVERNEIERIKDTLNEDIDDKTYIFRFDNLSTRSIPVTWGYDFEQHVPNHGAAYRVLQNAGHFYVDYQAIMNFDVIDLTYVNSAEEVTVVPVVSDPINITPYTTSVQKIVRTGCGGSSTFKLLLSFLILALLIVAVIMVIKFFQRVNTARLQRQTAKNLNKMSKIQLQQAKNNQYKRRRPYKRYRRRY